MNIFNSDIKMDIKSIGTGIWYMLHVLAINAVDDKSKEAFIITVNSLCNNFGCDHCQKHFRRFIDEHSFTDYWNIITEKKEDIGFFQWTWELHNNVNIKLNKQVLSLEKALLQYKSSVCKNCNNSTTITIPKPILVYTNNTTSQSSLQPLTQPSLHPLTQPLLQPLPHSLLQPLPQSLSQQPLTQHLPQKSINHLVSAPEWLTAQSSFKIPINLVSRS